MIPATDPTDTVVGSDKASTRCTPTLPSVPRARKTRDRNQPVPTRLKRRQVLFCAIACACSAFAGKGSGGGGIECCGRRRQRGGGQPRCTLLNRLHNSGCHWHYWCVVQSPAGQPFNHSYALPRTPTPPLLPETKPACIVPADGVMEMLPLKKCPRSGFIAEAPGASGPWPCSPRAAAGDDGRQRAYRGGGAAAGCPVAGVEWSMASVNHTISPLRRRGFTLKQVRAGGFKHRDWGRRHTDDTRDRERGERRGTTKGVDVAERALTVVTLLV